MARPRQQALNNRKRLRLKRAGTRTGGGRRFESPLLHQEVRANRRDFLECAHWGGLFQSAGLTSCWAY
jgi:hypothetical protein